MPTSIAAVAEKARESDDLNLLIEAIPYARLLGIGAKRENNELLFFLPPKNSNIGNPTLPALHGGAIGGFMEMSATLHVLMSLDVLHVPKVVDFSIDYIRAGRLLETYARCNVVREGRRLVNVSIQAWQQQAEQPIATARAHFLITP